jgi:iron complex outermembrane receptor protein
MGRTGLNYATNEFESKYTPIDAAGYQGQYGYELNKDFTITSEAMATAHKDNILDNLNASFSVGGSSWYNKFDGSRAWNKGPFANPNLYYLSNYYLLLLMQAGYPLITSWKARSTQRMVCWI